MYIYQLTGRAKSKAKAEEICRIFQHNIGIVQEPGYARGYCAIKQDDPLCVLIQEEWYNVAGLRSWQASEAFTRLKQTVEPLLEGIWEVVEYHGQQ